jgi:hypothetical protein
MLETPSLLFFSFCIVFLKAQFLDLFSSFYIPFLSVLSHLIHLQIIICMQMILNFSHHSLLTTGCHLTFFISISLRLSFFLLVFLNNYQNSVFLSFSYLIMSIYHLFNLLVIKESSLIAISLLLNTFLLFLYHAFVIFVTSDAFIILLIILLPALLLLL